MNSQKVPFTVLSVMITLASVGISSNAKAAPGEVLILDTTVTGGLSSPEAAQVIALGFTPVLVDNATWAAMTTAQFSDYEAIILGDPTCVESPAPVTAAEGNAATWADAVDGNVIIIGTDPTFHRFAQAGAQTLIENGISFALADAGSGTTGAYIALSCYYHSSGPTSVPVLAGFGSFTLQGAGTTGALNDAHIVASHPALSGLTDALLSNWINSVHEHFINGDWPAEFEVLTLALSGSGDYTAGDGTVGFPYILARGVIPEQCGDGNLDPGEECDDGNNTDGDGCDAACNIEAGGCTDDDGDGICNSDDMCDGTILPEHVPTVSLGVNRFADTDGDGVFNTTSPKGKGPGYHYTLEDTAGCSCEQIIHELGLGSGHTKFGCSISAMNEWLEVVACASESPVAEEAIDSVEPEIPDAAVDSIAPQVGACSLGGRSGSGAGWTLLGLMLAAVGHRRRKNG